MRVVKNLLSEAYKGQNVLITGHTGFKGSWLAIWLIELGANVIGFALDPPSDKGNFSLGNLKDKIVDIRGDIRDSKKLNEVFKKYKPHTVFHLAAQPLVRYSYQEPKYTYEVNVIGTLNVLDAIRITDEARVGIIITSDKCYENKESIWGYRENDEIGGYDPYSSSKGCSELLVSSYRNSYFNTKKYNEHGKVIASVRAGNVIGGGDWSVDRIIPDTINALKLDKPILVRSPKAIRPWQHILEPLSGYLYLGSKIINENIKYSGAWNFGPNTEDIITVEEIVDKVIKAWGYGKWFCPSLDSHALHEASKLSLDISKAKYYLGWKPRWNVEKAIEKTVEWYKNYHKEDAYKICVKQINEYYIS